VLSSQAQIFEALFASAKEASREQFSADSRRASERRF